MLRLVATDNSGVIYVTSMRLCGSGGVQGGSGTYRNGCLQLASRNGCCHQLTSAQTEEWLRQQYLAGTQSARNCLVTGFGSLLKLSGKQSSVPQCLMDGLFSRPMLLASKQALTTSIQHFSSHISTAPLAILGLRNSGLLTRLFVPHCVNQSRTVIKFSLKKGKRKTVKAVLARFYRLNWGIWIRSRAGCYKKIWKKSYQRRRRIRQHVFTNSTQSYMLDKMVTRFWRKPKYYVDDPYEPYHSREEFPLTRRKFYVPVD